MNRLYRFRIVYRENHGEDTEVTIDAYSLQEAVSMIFGIHDDEAWDNILMWDVQPI